MPITTTFPGSGIFFAGPGEVVVNVLVQLRQPVAFNLQYLLAGLLKIKTGL